MTQVKSSHIELDIRPATARVGAQISGVNLSGDLPDAAIAAINAAILKYKVVFFREQSHLTDAEQERFSARLGKLTPHPTVASKAGTSSILELDSTRGGGRADAWHTDVTFVAAYPKISVLRGVVIPEFGGDTIWSNTVAVYEHLPAPLKAAVDNLWAIHTNGYDYAALRPHASDLEKRHFEEVFSSTVYETEHPVVRVHPDTGERSLILGSFVQRFVGLSRADSESLLQILQAHVTRPENTVRWRWRAGDVAIWDNQATQHYAVNDYGSATRVVRRTTIEGDVPVGIDGRRSIARKEAKKSVAARAA